MFSHIEITHLYEMLRSFSTGTAGTSGQPQDGHRTNGGQPRQSGTGAADGNKCKGKGTSGHQRAPAGTRRAGTRRAPDQRRPATTIGHPGSSGQRQRQRHCRNCCSHEGSVTLPRRLAQQHRYFCLCVSADSCLFRFGNILIVCLWIWQLRAVPT